jgi:hypothetical protein
MKSQHTYIGDAVYLEFDGECIILRTGDHRDCYCNDVIHMDKRMLDKINQFVNDCLDNKPD